MKHVRNDPFQLPRVSVYASIVLLVVAGCRSVVVKEEESVTITKKASSSYVDGRIARLQKKAAEYTKRDDYQYEIAGLYFEREEYHEAERHLKRAIVLSPDNPRYHFHLGRVYLKMREVDLAESSFRAAAETSAEGRYSGFHCALGLVKSMKKDHAGAESEFEEAVAAEPDNPEPYYFLAAVSDLQGKREKAERNFREYLLRGGKLYRSNAIFFLEKLGIIVDRKALERAERLVVPVDPLAGG